jgi:hypothetical protein
MDGSKSISTVRTLICRILGLTGLLNMMLENRENPLNKYNRRFGEAFVDGRFCVFAVIRQIGVLTRDFSQQNKEKQQ